MGRMEPGESFAVVPIPEKIITEKVFSLELVSIAFCNRNEHAASHFPVVQRSAFPEQPPYEEFIDVRRPRPLPVIHRRRTMYIERAPRHAMDEEFESMVVVVDLNVLTMQIVLLLLLLLREEEVSTTTT
jgi:hypothetical protein